MRSRTWRIRGAALLLAFVQLGILGCSGSDPALPETGRVLVLGIEGASPRLMTPLIERGDLPILARLAAVGTYGHLRSEAPIHSPRVWNTIATGQSPDAHGITASVLEDGQRTRLFSSHDRRVPPLWNILSESGRSVAVVSVTL